MNLKQWQSSKQARRKVAPNIEFLCNDKGFKFFRFRCSREGYKVNTKWTSSGDFKTDMDMVDACRTAMRNSQPLPFSKVSTDPNRQTPFRTIAPELIAVCTGELSNIKNRKQWYSTIETYVNPVIGDIPISEITVSEIVRVFERDRFWWEKPETAGRVRQRLERIFAKAKIRGLRQGDNPAAYNEGLEGWLPKARRLVNAKKIPMPSMDYREIPKFYARWCEEVGGQSGMALRLLILLVLRPGNIAQATWDHWLPDIPCLKIKADDMKVDLRLVQPVPVHAEEIIRWFEVNKSDPVWLCPNSVSTGPMSTDAIAQRCRIFSKLWGYRDVLGNKDYVVPHGFRATFKTWAEETIPNAERNVIESILAHSLGGQEDTYMRGDYFIKKKDYLSRWGDYVTSSL